MNKFSPRSVTSPVNAVETAKDTIERYPVIMEALAKAEVVKHPGRYPRHESDKGQVWNGECNMTRCAHVGAIFFNNQTYGYYCPDCAFGINRFSNGLPICVEVEGSLTIEQMNDIHRVDLEARYGEHHER